MNIGVVYGDLDDGEQLGACDFEVANAVQRHLARVVVAVGCEPQQARADLREIFAPKPDHQVGRRPPDIAVVVSHRLAQCIRGIHRERAGTNLRERIRGSPSHATIRACDRLAKFFNDERVTGRGNRDEFIDRTALNGFARIAKFANQVLDHSRELCRRRPSIHTRYQAHEIGQFARAEKKIAVMAKCVCYCVRDRR